ncbi:MAG: Uma2 family endonuclease [Spirulina sp.]
MTSTETETFTPLPDHTQLPCEDGTFVKNFQEHPQSILLTTSIRPILDRRHPDGQYCIGQDSGIYWRMTDPPQNGAEAPDWFYVPNVPPNLDGQPRRSYVLWQEIIPPQIVLEFVSGNGAEERDKTPWKGKFWVYETVIRPAYYGIYEVRRERVEVYRLRESGYELIPPNSNDRFPIETLGVELGLWQGMYQNLELPWLRWWDSEGNLLPSAEERADLAEEDRDRERERANLAEARVQDEQEKNQQLRVREALL